MLKFIAQFFMLFVTFAAPATGSEHFKGELYQNNSKPQVKGAMDMIEKIIPPKEEGFELLDVGCRDGKITNYIATLFPSAKVTGLDPNESMIQIARASSSPIEWIKLSIEDSEYVNKFDLVTSFSALHWLKDLDFAFTKIYAAMKPNAQAYFVSCAKKDLESRLGYSIEFQRQSKKWKDIFLNEPPRNDVIKLYAVEDMNARLQKASFIISECQMAQSVHTFSSRKEFNNWVCGWSPYKNLLKERHEEFWDDVIDKYCVFNAPYDEGKIDYIDYVLHIIVKKNAV